MKQKLSYTRLENMGNKSRIKTKKYHKFGNGKVVDRSRLFWINAVGTTAALLSSITLVPQVHRLIKTRNISSLSLYSGFLIMATSLLWITYNLLVGTYHGIFSSTLNLINASIITYMVVTIRYMGAEGVDTPL